MFDLDRSWPDAGLAPDVSAQDTAADCPGCDQRIDRAQGDGAGLDLAAADSDSAQDLAPDSGDICGDGKLTGSEPCDGTLLGSKTCLSLGYAGGTLACTAKCALDTLLCQRVLDPKGVAIAAASKGDRLWPSVAFDGTRFLVAWHGNGTYSGAWEIFGAWVSQAATVSKPLGVATGNRVRYNAYVAFDGINYLVTYAIQITNKNWNASGVRMDTAGKILMSGVVDKFPISTAAGNQLYPVSAFGGASFLVAWEDTRGGAADIYGAQVDSNGKVKHPSGIVLSKATKVQERPAVAYGGNVYLVAWRDLRSGNYDIYAARVDHSGKVLDSTRIPVSTAAGEQSNPAVAYDGANFQVVWQDKRNGKDFNIHGARVTPAGKVLDPTGLVVSSAKGAQWMPKVACDGKTCLVVWDDQRASADDDIYGARVTPSGKVLDSAGFVIGAAAGKQRWSSVAFGKTDYLVVWTDKRSGYLNGVYGTRVRP